MNRSNNPGPLPRLADVAPTQRPVQHRLPRLADVAPRELPNQHRQPAPYDYGHLQQSLDCAHRKIGEWNQWYETVEPMLYNVNGVETAYGYRIRSTATIRRLQQDLVNKKWESAEQLKKWDKEISSLVKSRDDWKKKVKQLEEQLSQKDSEIQTFKEDLTKKDSEISILKENLQKKTEEANNIENSQKEEYIKMTAGWQVEKAILSAFSQLKQDESLQKMKQLEEQLSQKNAEILTLKNEELSKRDSEICFLKESLQKKSEEVDKMECLWKKQCSYMTATWEAEKASLLASSKEMMQIQDEKMKQLEERFSQRGAQILELQENLSKIESETTSSLQIQKQYDELWDELAKKEESWKVTIKQLKDEKDILNDVLVMNKEDLSKMEMEFSNLLTTKEAELRQSEKTWQTKYDALEAQRTNELSQKEQSWEDRVRQMEEEKNTLQELYSKKVEKRGRRFWSHKKKVKSQTQLEEAGETDKEKKKEKKQKEKEEKKTGFRSWLHKKDSNSKVEEAADCSVQAGQ